MRSFLVAPALGMAGSLIALVVAARSGFVPGRWAAASDPPHLTAGEPAAPTRPSSSPPPLDGPRGPGTAETTGPWGTLQSFPIYIAAPDWSLASFPLPSAVTTWTFRGLAPADVSAAIDRPGLPEAAARELLDQSRWQVIGDAIRVFPGDATVRSLPSDVRADIYDVLARWEDNEFQHAPYYIPDNDARVWLAGTGLPDHLVDLVARTSYPVGEARCFSDLALLVGATSSHAEGRLLLKALSRSRTMILRVLLDDPADVPRIRDYWSAGSANAKDFLPLLESLATNTDVRYLDVVHLLPPLARKLLYTFPTPELAVGGRYPDCHWTSLNFFNQTPESRLADVAGAAMFATGNLHPAEPPFRYGDVLFFVDRQDSVIHSCVYLADDFVYTKNGANVLSPWLIMDLEEVRARYSRHGPVDVRIYRR